jgi:hypothetical protein
MLRSVAQWNLGLVEWLRGRLADAERALPSTSSQRRGIGERGLGVVMRDHLGQVQRARGQLDAARDTYQRTLAITAPPGGPVMPGAEAALVGQAEVAYERNDLDTALRHASEGIPLCRQFVYTPPLAAGLVTLAWIRQARGDPAGAREAVGEAGRVAPSPGVAGLLNPVPAQRARLAAAESPEPGGQRDRDPGAAGAGAGRGRRGGRRGGCPSPGAHLGLPAGLCPGVRRRRRTDERATCPAGRRPEGRPGRRPRSAVEDSTSICTAG